MATMISVQVPREIVHATRMSVDELKRELALTLFQQGKLSFGKARELAGMTAWDFQLLLGSRKIPVHYDIQDYEDDVATLRDWGDYDYCQRHFPQAAVGCLA